MGYVVFTALYASFLMMDFRRVVKKKDKRAIIFSIIVYTATFVCSILVLAGVKLPSLWKWLLYIFYDVLGMAKPQLGI